MPYQRKDENVPSTTTSASSSSTMMKSASVQERNTESHISTRKLTILHPLLHPLLHILLQHLYIVSH